MDKQTLREMRKRWRRFKRQQPQWCAGEDEAARFSAFCELELLGPERVQALLDQGYFSESLQAGNC